MWENDEKSANVKYKVNFTRIKLNSECSKAELEEMIEILE